MGLFHRNTDMDWRLIGAKDPYWGVLSHEHFRHGQIDPAGLSHFYESGKTHLQSLNALVEAHTGAPIKAVKALDFGCGVGRVTHHMTGYAEEAIGVDISDDMLKVAARQPNPSARFSNEIPDQSFDWIHSFLVFQHIPPQKGLGLLKTLLSRLSPNGLVTLHFTTDRAEALKPKHLAGRLMDRLKVRLRPAGRISMFDYDPAVLKGMFEAAGIFKPAFVPMVHEDHYAVMVIGRRGAA